MHGATWQRCRVHFLRNVLAMVPKAAQEMVAATISTVFVQPDPALAREQWRKVADGFRARYPRLAELLDEAEDDVLADLAFPREHWRQIWSTNPLEVAWTQDPISPRGPAQRQDVADLHIRRLDDYPLDEQFDQGPALRERRPLQPAGDRRAKLIDAGDHDVELVVAGRLGLPPLLLAA